MTYLYETPWWLPIGLVFIGGVLFWTGNKRQEKRLMYGGVAAILLAGLLSVLSWYLESNREIVTDRTYQLVAAVEKRNWPAMGELLHPQVSALNWRGRDRLVRGARDYAERYNLRRARVSGLQADEMDSNTVTVTMRVFADAADLSTTPFDWKLEWERTSQGWLCRQVEPLGSPVIGSLDGYFK